MKGSSFSLCLFSTVFLLLMLPSLGLKRLHLGSCVLSMNFQEMRNEFLEIKGYVQAEDGNLDKRILKSSEALQDTKPTERCCFFRHLLRFYLDRVFKNYQTTNHHIRRKVSSLANSFLGIKKELRLCHDHMICHCGEEAKKKYTQILSHFEELDAQTAVVKALGELDILLRWIEKTK
ncbi:interleukin-20 isoform X1 [Gracilinanus agilis]|uniref:interleukin-20 isoform X1 n=1 Tax=Gracilinanus agilis TaxID=191870 RepID=UPI001CFCC09E|nr:interleukin-20 isoform X1 [Gracilinanus agilis]